jgi:hypothetical protein
MVSRLWSWIVSRYGAIPWNLEESLIIFEFRVGDNYIIASGTYNCQIAGNYRTLARALDQYPYNKQSTHIIRIHLLAKSVSHKRKNKL